MNKSLLLTWLLFVGGIFGVSTSSTLLVALLRLLFFSSRCATHRIFSPPYLCFLSRIPRRPCHLFLLIFELAKVCQPLGVLFGSFLQNLNFLLLTLVLQSLRKLLLPQLVIGSLIPLMRRLLASFSLTRHTALDTVNKTLTLLL